MDNKKEKRCEDMSEQRSHLVVNFLVRGILGTAMIFFINQFLETKGISCHVGLNPLTFCASGFFGAPGVALLYGITFYQGL